MIKFIADRHRLAIMLTRQSQFIVVYEDLRYIYKPREVVPPVVAAFERGGSRLLHTKLIAA